MVEALQTADSGAAHREQATKRKRGRRGGRRRGKAATLRGRLLKASDELALAKRQGRVNDAERLRTDIFGRDGFPGEGLLFKSRSLHRKQEDEVYRLLAKRLGISLNSLAEIARRRDRYHGSTPDEKLGRGMAR